RLVVIGDGSIILAGFGICIALADQGSVAFPRLGFSPLALLLLRRRPESSDALLLGLLTLALSVRLGRCCSCVAFLLHCQPLFLRLLHLAVSIRLSLLKFGLEHTMSNECVGAHAN